MEYRGIKMSFVASVISLVLKSVVSKTVESELANELIGISIDGILENRVAEISNFISGEESKIKHILSKENLKSMNIPEEYIEFVIAEIKDLLSKSEVTDEVLKQCEYSEEKLKEFLWNEYCSIKKDIEYESDIKKGLYVVAEEIMKLKSESKKFEEELLIQINSSVKNINYEQKKIADYIEENFTKINKNDQKVLDMLRMMYEQIQKSGIQNEDKIWKIKSRTSEYAKKWNDNMFLNNFNKRDENANINVKLKEVYLESQLPHYKWKQNDRESDDLKDLLSEYINENNDNKMLLILGQPGIGKSTLIIWITANFTKSIDRILVYQFASDLKNVDWQNTSKNYNILDEILNVLGLSYNDLNGKILIIDGFDEISIGTERAKILNQLYWKLIEKNSVSNFSLIITCRENYIKELDKVEYSYITLQTWNEEQIRSFCTIYQKRTNSNVLGYILEGILEKQKILGIPLILYMVLALNIKIGREDSIVAVYDQIFALEGGIYERCIKNDRFASIHRINEIKVQIHQVSREIALWMFENNPNQAFIPRKEYLKICDVIIEEQAQENEEIKQDFLIGNYFRLVKHCEGVETEKLYFVHRSIYEYFVAEYIFASICKAICISKENLASIFGSMLKGNILSAKILEFLKFKIRNSKLNKEFDAINKAFQLMLQDGMTYYTNKCYKNVIKCEIYVFTNMLEILHLWENSCLKFENCVRNYLIYNNYKIDGSFLRINLQKADLRGLWLKNVNLNYAYLENAYLENAELENAQLNSAELNSAKLNGAKLNHADLNNAKLHGAELNHADLRFAELNNADLKFAKLNHADLEGAELNAAELVGVHLNHANLEGADLRNANLFGAELEDIKLYHARLTDAIFDETQVSYLRNHYDLSEIKVYISKTNKVISYTEYINTTLQL